MYTRIQMQTSTLPDPTHMPKYLNRKKESFRENLLIQLSMVNLIAYGRVWLFAG